MRKTKADYKSLYQMLPDYKSGRADSCRFTFYVCFNVNRRKTVIYPLRIIHARFMKIYVLCPEGATGL